jgi:hypothetical protein
MKRERTALVAIAVACLLAAMGNAISAQVEVKTTEIKNFEVVSVHGNTVVAKAQDGAKEYNVPDDFRFTIDGKKITVHELKPGMKGTATITTTTTSTPVYVTDVKTGEVTKVFGNSVVVYTGNEFKLFTEDDVQKRGFTIMKGGEPVSFADLRVGDKLTATIITSAPPREVTKQDVDAMITSPPPAPPAAGGAPPSPASGGGTSPASSSPATPATSPVAAPPVTSTPVPPPPASQTPTPAETQPPGMNSTLIIGGIGVVLLVVLIAALSGLGKKKT